MKLQVKGKVYEAKGLGRGRAVVELSDVSELREAVKQLLSLRECRPGYLEAITAVDEPEKGVIELHYLFWCHPVKTVVDVVVRTGREKPIVDSIVDIVPAARPYEMEVFDLLGVVFQGNKWLREGFLKPGEMVGTYPLRKK